MRQSLLRAIPWVAAATAVAVVVVPGCGTSGDELFGGTTGATASSGAGAAGTGAAPSAGPTSGNGGDSSGPGPGPGTQSSGPGPGAGGQGGDPSSGPGPGGAADGGASSGEPSSSSGPPPVPPVQCGGGVECTLGQESCCWDANQWNGDPQGECVTGGPITDNCNTDYAFFEAGAETRIECQLPEHCDSGQVCCGHRNIYGQGQDAFVYYDTTVCQDDCGFDDRILCNPVGPDGCPDGATCQPSTILPPGYHICSFN